MEKEQKRFLTTTVKLISKKLNRLPVRTSGNILRSKLREVVIYLNDVEVKAPVKINQIIVENVLNLGADIISTREVLE